MGNVCGFSRHLGALFLSLGYHNLVFFKLGSRISPANLQRNVAGVQVRGLGSRSGIPLINLWQVYKTRIYGVSCWFPARKPICLLSQLKKQTCKTLLWGRSRNVEAARKTFLEIKGEIGASQVCSGKTGNRKHHLIVKAHVICKRKAPYIFIFIFYKI